MLVYGDSRSEHSLEWERQTLCGRITLATQHDVAWAREVLIAAGQLEQGVHDALIPDAHHAVDERVAYMHALTRASGRVFYAFLSGDPTRAEDHLRRLQALARAAPALGGVAGHFRIPEGFAYYGVFPEQYCQAAQAWSMEHRSDNPPHVLVVGVRSIGTTLAAVVAATLEAMGFPVRSFTVRPVGPPFARELTLAPAAVAGDAHALVVDEGPGLSGSSMASVAQALWRAGMQPEQVSFLPSHGGEPGPEASARVREVWQRTRTYVFAPNAPIFGGTTLTQTLAKGITKMGLGEVKQVAEPGSGHWPPTPSIAGQSPLCSPFARPKYYVSTDYGELLLTFYGLASVEGMSLAARAVEVLRRRHINQFGPPPLGCVEGFVAVPWLHGTCANPGSAGQVFDDTLARYLVSTRGPILNRSARTASLERLTEIVTVNAERELGLNCSEWFMATRLLQDLPAPYWAASTDGELGPAYWLRTEAGRWCKLGSPVRGHDPTAPGVQPILWDVAGAIVDWPLSPQDVAVLLHRLEQQLGARAPRRAIDVYLCAFLAYRVGWHHVCSQATPTPSEYTAHQSAVAACRARLEHTLGCLH